MKTHTITSIQALRAIAASLVVLFHAQLTTISYGGEAATSDFFHFKEFGAVGVDIFFVISGFIMIFVTQGKYSHRGSVRYFIVKRLIRVVPIYWFYTSVMVALLLLLPSLFREAGFDRTHVILSYLFIPAINSIGVNSPVIFTGWSLSYELYFYFMFAFGLLYSRKLFVFLLSIWLCLSASVSIFFSGLGPILQMLTEPILLEFVFGCIIGVIYFEKKTFPVYLSGGLIAIGLLGFFLTIIFGNFGLHRFIIWGIPSFCLVTGLVFWEKTAKIKYPPGLVALGDSSYSLYLVHVFTLPLFGKIWSYLGAEKSLSADLFVISAVIGSVAVGHVCYLILEKPLVKLLSNKYKNYKIRLERREGNIHEKQKV